MDVLRTPDERFAGLDGWAAQEAVELKAFTPNVTVIAADVAAAGLLAGAFAAAVYCLHCPETSAIFVLIWYSLGILATSLLGALLGPRLLRW